MTSYVTAERLDVRPCCVGGVGVERAVTHVGPYVFLIS